MLQFSYQRARLNNCELNIFVAFSRRLSHKTKTLITFFVLQNFFVAIVNYLTKMNSKQCITSEREEHMSSSGGIFYQTYLLQSHTSQFAIWLLIFKYFISKLDISTVHEKYFFLFVSFVEISDVFTISIHKFLNSSFFSSSRKIFSFTNSLHFNWARSICFPSLKHIYTLRDPLIDEANCNLERRIFHMMWGSTFEPQFRWNERKKNKICCLVKQFFSFEKLAIERRTDRSS